MWRREKVVIRQREIFWTCFCCKLKLKSMNQGGPVNLLFRLAVATVAVVLVWFLVLPHISRSAPAMRNAPLIREVFAIHEICSKLRHYADEHHPSSSGNATGETVDSLVASGVLSVNDAAYIREHHIAFRGFDPNRIGFGIVVMETVFTNGQTAHRIVGYSDGHVVAYDSHNTK
jgi:hypothetical protein